MVVKEKKVPRRSLKMAPIGGGLRPFSDIHLGDMGKRLQSAEDDSVGAYMDPGVESALANPPNTQGLPGHSLPAPIVREVDYSLPALQQRLMDRQAGPSPQDVALDAILEPTKSPDGGGIGLQGTLGILNTGAGLAGMIMKGAMAAKKPKRRLNVPMPSGGNPMRRR